MGSDGNGEGGSLDEKFGKILEKEKKLKREMDGQKNLLNDVEARRRSKCIPWSADSQDPGAFMVETDRLQNFETESILKKVQSYGICHIRIAADIPSTQRLETLESSLGPAFEKQNNFTGKVKEIKPSPEVEANTGDSSKALPLHVDGTQHERTPALLVFQYVLQGRFGGHSTFLDLAHVFSTLGNDEFREVISDLSADDCAKFDKNGMRYSGPLLTVTPIENALACRLRFDSVLTVAPRYKEAFDLLRERISEHDYLTIEPRVGDIIIFDNWRLMHGRTEVHGNYQRHHDRMWINQLKNPYDVTFNLGVRPISSQVIAKIKANNGH